MLQYRDMSAWTDGVDSLQLPEANARAKEPQKRAEVEMTEAEFNARIARERSDAAREVEQALKKDFEEKALAARAQFVTEIQNFGKQRDDYFAKVESEVVQLALSIAGKILHREAQVDPMLVAALVRIAMEGMREGSSVTVRVAPERAEAWRQCFANSASASRAEIAEDPALSGNDCVVETELGTANFGLDAQLKEVERGFFDLLALRPATK
jgi:Flagellar biosynthesis/type III secretory pathway protein